MANQSITPETPKRQYPIDHQHVEDFSAATDASTAIGAASDMIQLTVYKIDTERADFINEARRLAKHLTEMADAFDAEPLALPAEHNMIGHRARKIDEAIMRLSILRDFVAPMNLMMNRHASETAAASAPTEDIRRD